MYNSQITYRHRPAERADNAGAIVLLHGFGADAQDLFSLADWLDPAGAWHWYFPQAPIAIHPYGGYVWFPDNPAQLQQILTSGHFPLIDKADPPGLREQAKAVADLIERLALQWHSVVVGGFSQGAMVAAELVFGRRANGLPLPAGMLLLSGAIIAAERWRSNLLKAASVNIATDRAAVCPYLQTHGTADPVLPIEYARSLHELLVATGFSGRLMEFNEGHTIPSQLLHRSADPSATGYRHRGYGGACAQGGVPPLKIVRY